MKKHSIPEKEKEKIMETLSSALEKEVPILFGYVFGSFVEADFKDIDVAIYIDEGKVISFLQYEIQLESLLSNEIGRFTFDVRILNGAPLSFKYEVIKGGKLILAKDDEKRVDFETSTFSYYFDFAPYRDRYLKEVLNIGD